LTDSYDIFAVGLLTTMLGIVYWPKKGTMPTNSDTAIKVATSGGTIVGQLGFGALADIVGRKRMYGLELIVIIFATLAQALTSNSPSMNIVVCFLDPSPYLVACFSSHCRTPFHHNLRQSSANTVFRVSLSSGESSWELVCSTRRLFVKY
jgi:MFS family permease